MPYQYVPGYQPYPYQPPMPDQLAQLRGAQYQPMPQQMPQAQPQQAKFKVSFGANIAIPAGGTAEAITAAISINGEALNASTATVTPAAAENFFNIYVSAVVDVPRGCCVTVAAKNTSTQPILVANSNFIVERVA